jgi:hypothetical protein
MVHQSYFTAFNAHSTPGTKWVETRLLHLAKEAGLEIGRCRWAPDAESPDGDDEVEERMVLTFCCGEVEFWEPFDLMDLEDSSRSERVRKHLGLQVKQIVDRVEHSVRQPEAPPVLAPTFLP